MTTAAAAATTTKCVDLNNIKLTSNPISFVKEMNPVDLNFTEPFSKPNEFKNIELVRKAVLPETPKMNVLLMVPTESPNRSVDFKEEPLFKDGTFEYFDIMFAYDDDRTKGTLYLGYWNDGIVESK